MTLKKFISFILILVAFTIVNLAVSLTLKKSTQCKEAAFLASSSYGTGPRRYFDVSLVKTYRQKLIKHFTYKISMANTKVSEVTVSSFRCKKVREIK